MYAGKEKDERQKQKADLSCTFEMTKRVFGWTCPES